MKEYIVTIGFQVTADSLDEAEENAIKYLQQIDYIKSEEIQEIK